MGIFNFNYQYYYYFYCVQWLILYVANSVDINIAWFHCYKLIKIWDDNKHQVE